MTKDELTAKRENDSILQSVKREDENGELNTYFRTCSMRSGSPYDCLWCGLPVFSGDRDL